MGVSTPASTSSDSVSCCVEQGQVSDTCWTRPPFHTHTRSSVGHTRASVRHFPGVSNTQREEEDHGREHPRLHQLRLRLLCAVSGFRNVQQFRGGLVFKAHRLRVSLNSVSCGSEAGSYLRLIDFVYHSTSRLESNQGEEEVPPPPPAPTPSPAVPRRARI